MMTIKGLQNLSELNVSHNQMMETSLYNSIVGSFSINRWKFKNRRFHYLYSFLAIAIFTSKTTFFVFGLISNLNAKPIDSIFISYLVSEIWLLFFSLETIVYPSIQFIKSFDMIWTQIPFSTEPVIVKEVMKAQKFVNITSIFLFLVSIVFNVVSGTLEYLSRTETDTTFKYHFFCVKFFELYTSFMFINIFRGFLISGKYIKIGHRYIHCQIIEIVKDVYASDLTVYRLRHQHYDLTRCGELCDLAFRRFATFNCLTAVPNTILIFFNLAYTDLNLINATINIVEFIKFLIFMVLFLPCLIGFYSYPGEARDDLYLATLVERSNTFKSEVLLFMDLLNQRSSGIKFMGIYLITPSIIPNLATIVFTYVMAAPNFIE